VSTKCADNPRHVLSLFFSLTLCLPRSVIACASPP
jgi:hypothetical protein